MIPREELLFTLAMAEKGLRSETPPEVMAELCRVYLASQWQPIESAPHGEEVLVYTSVGNPSTREGVCTAAFSYEDDGEQWWIADSGDYVLNPSHWMPLPEAPDVGR